MGMGIIRSFFCLLLFSFIISPTGVATKQVLPEFQQTFDMGGLYFSPKFTDKEGFCRFYRSPFNSYLSGFEDEEKEVKIQEVNVEIFQLLNKLNLSGSGEKDTIWTVKKGSQTSFIAFTHMTLLANAVSENKVKFIPTSHSGTREREKPKKVSGKKSHRRFVISKKGNGLKKYTSASNKQHRAPSPVEEPKPPVVKQTDYGVEYYGDLEEKDFKVALEILVKRFIEFPENVGKTLFFEYDKNPLRLKAFKGTYDAIVQVFQALGGELKGTYMRSGHRVKLWALGCKTVSGPMQKD